ncbi:MAG: T9SS type A sorting domain-containing protein [Bacteroidetes bacterium]|nr:MAG: T9SS type A sorting domain-containing protein [Bacteroidota bacterium]
MKKLNLYLIVITLYLFPCAIYCTEWVVSNQLDSNNNGNDWNLIASYDSLNCIIVGSDFNGIPRVIISEDAGKTWKYILNVAISEYMKDTSLKFTRPNAVYYDEDKIFIWSWDNNDKQAYFLTSFNKGESWELKKTDIVCGGIKFEKNEGVLFGFDKIYYSSDNGTSWEVHDITIPEAYGVAEMVRFNSIDEFSILMVSQTNKKAWLCKTINRGKDWEINTIPYYCRYMSFKFFDDNIGWVIGRYPNGIGDQSNDVILKTIDGGKSWQKVADSAFKNEIVIPAGVYDVDVISKDEAIVVGSTTKALYTKDGGNTWEILSKGVNVYGKLLFKVVKFIAPKTIIAGGWDNFVARYELDDNVSVEDYEKVNEEVIIYANPTNDFLQLKSNNTLDKIEIFSALGIKILETEYKDKIDVGRLSAGVYFLKTGDTVYKFVKM